jgi:hypothetical protein
MRPHRGSAFDDATPVDRRGHRLPETLAALARRDELIREAVQRLFQGASGHEAARLLHQALERYASCAWQREQSAPECPSRHVGRLTASCWHILDAVDRVPSEPLIRKIIAGKLFVIHGT